MNPEQSRLHSHYHTSDSPDWLFWGPYLADRHWGTVREDYSADGNAWDFFPHDHARSRAYRWGEDGLGGICDKEARLCFALALWNGKDPILKERLFGLTGPEGNHGEDVKELYYHLDSTPTHSYMRFLFKYQQTAYPYGDIVGTNARRGKEGEYELLDTGVFDEGRYFDVFITYAKGEWDDICIEIEVCNRGPEDAPIWVLPNLWFRNTWDFAVANEKPYMAALGNTGDYVGAWAQHPEVGNYYFYAEAADTLWFTENETNYARIFDVPNRSPFVKDAFHRALIEEDADFLSGRTFGTKCAPVYARTVPAGESLTFRQRLTRQEIKENPFGESFTQILNLRKSEADTFYEALTPTGLSAERANIQRQAFAGLMWTKQFYYYDIIEWLKGDPGHLSPPHERQHGRNHSWRHLNNADIISMPDKWEYPWYAVWDLAFHCVPIAMIDPDFAKEQLILMLREWYMHPNGQIPAYEWNFSDVNPPVHAWAALEIFQMEKRNKGRGDIAFLKRIFQKLLLNFTWWVNRKDVNGNNVFEGGFLGLDNIGIFDRSADLPNGGHLEQADGTAWMGAFSLHMMQIALEISCEDPTFEDMATKFFEHFTYITETLNRSHELPEGMWEEEEGFYYDKLILPNGQHFAVKVRSLVGLSPMFAVTMIPTEMQAKVPNFMARMAWFRHYRQDKGKTPIVAERDNGDILLAMVPQERMVRLLTAMMNEDEFLAPGGIRSLSKRHGETPYTLELEDGTYGLHYEPGESTTDMFGGNSNWRGPVWLPMNYMFLHALDIYHSFYEELCLLHLPESMGQTCSLQEIADHIAQRLIGMFEPDETGLRPIHQPYTIYAEDPHFKELVLFYEYFHGDTSRGIGASHQTGWTALVAELIDRMGRRAQEK